MRTLDYPGQYDIDHEAAHARRTDPTTAHDAAATVAVNEMEELVLAALAALGNATCSEMATHTGLPRDSISPRIKPLVEKGLVLDTGERRAGPTRRKQIVWRRARAA